MCTSTKNLFFDSTAECNSCFETDSASCKTNQKPQFCATSEDSLGTSHCASMAGSFRDQNGNKVNGFYRGCVDCSGDFMSRSL